MKYSLTNPQKRVSYIENSFDVRVTGGLVMKIIAGLGNPGREFADTRHNMGFNVIDYLANRNNIEVKKIKFKGLCGDGFIGNSRVLLLKPQTFMNLSGESILDAVQFYKAEVEDLLVIYDDLSLPLGRIRIRPSGSDGGHNGMKSIIYLLGRNDFPRLRVGIGAPEFNMVDHVIGKFEDMERNVASDMIKLSADAACSIVNEGIVQAMNFYNSFKHDSLLKDSE
jgi:PTH1 family peptidyl-tRNA hydrolase